jgi:hypothetical protein
MQTIPEAREICQLNHMTLFQGIEYTEEEIRSLPMQTILKQNSLTKVFASSLFNPQGYADTVERRL